ncbi:MAG: hypothetical protein IJT44_12635 [Clostridia bacterium]|nr:hypothetical protein [Clostridia bacterium]
MKKHSVLFKLAAMCLSVVMLFGMVGVIAYADECSQGGEHNWQVQYNDDGTVKYDETGHYFVCAKCGNTKSEKHELGYWSLGNKKHAQKCTACEYVKPNTEEACEYKAVYAGNKFDALGHPYHEFVCVKCGDVPAWDLCDVSVTPNGDNYSHTYTCADCNYEESARCVWGEWTYHTSANGTGIDVEEHNLFCEQCGQFLMSEPHDFSWESQGDQTLFKGNTMVRTCWCGYKDIPADAEALWVLQQGAPTEAKLVSADDLSYIHQFGLWVAGSGLFLLRVAFEPIRWVVNHFYHLDIFD